MSDMLKFLGQIGWIICVLCVQGALCVDFGDPETLALTIGCAIGGVIVLILVVTLCAFCYFRNEGSETQSQQGRSFDYDSGFQTRMQNGHPTAYPPNHHPNNHHPSNHSSILNGSSQQGGNQDNMNMPGVWTTNPSMYMGPHPPQPHPGGQYMTNGSYGSNPRPGYGPAAPPGQQNSMGRGPYPTQQQGSMPLHYMNGYYTQDPHQQQQQRQQRPQNKKSWYHRTVGRAQQALKNIPAVFQVKQSTKETMTYKKMFQKEEEMKRQQQAMRNVRSRQNGDVTSAARERHDVSRTSSNAHRLPRNGVDPHVGNGSVIMGREEENPDIPPNDPHVPTGTEEPINSVPPLNLPDDGPEPPVAKAFSDYREPADVLPPANDNPHVARAFSSYERGLDNNNRFVARAFSRQESEHKYALPQDALPMTQSEFTLNRNQQRISGTARSDEPYSPYMAKKYSNYVPGSGGSAGRVVDSRIPGQRGVVMRSPSDLQRLGNYRSASLERYASQYRSNMPQRGRTKAEIIAHEKAAKLAAKQQQKSKKSKLSPRDKHVVGIMKGSSNKHASAQATPQGTPRQQTGVGVARSYQTVPGPKNTPTQVTQHHATQPATQATQPSAYVATQQPVHASQPITTHAQTHNSQQHIIPQPTQDVHRSTPALTEDDPIYARPVKLHKKDKRDAADANRPLSIDVPTSNPAPFVAVSPDTPISPEPPAVPPHPSPAEAKTPQQQRQRRRMKSESASADFALAGDDVTSSAFQFLDDIDTDADASFRVEEQK